MSTSIGIPNLAVVVSVEVPHLERQKSARFACFSWLRRSVAGARDPGSTIRKEPPISNLSLSASSTPLVGGRASERGDDERSVDAADGDCPTGDARRGKKKLSSFIRSCIGDVIYDRYEKAKIK
jgi:hypothetical protein